MFGQIKKKKGKFCLLYNKAMHLFSFTLLRTVMVSLAHFRLFPLYSFMYVYKDNSYPVFMDF